MRCQGDLVPIERAGQFLFNFCRPCKIPHDAQGRAAIDLIRLNSSFNPLSTARGMIRKTNADAAPVTRTALETFMIQALTEAYVSGVKDGVLLAYSQDTVDEGEPYNGGQHGSKQPLQDSGGNSGQGR
jgi:hypothetical protein